MSKYFPPTCIFRLVFTMVSEPSSVDDGDCVDIAFAIVDILQVRSDTHAASSSVRIMRPLRPLRAFVRIISNGLRQCWSVHSLNVLQWEGGREVAWGGTKIRAQCGFPRVRFRSFKVRLGPSLRY